MNIEICNIAGVPIGRYKLPDGKNKIEINSRDLAKGIFFVKVIDDAGMGMVEKLVIY